MPLSAPKRPDQPEQDSAPLLDPREPGPFRRLYIVVALVVIVALVVGLLGPIVWRLV